MRERVKILCVDDDGNVLKSIRRLFLDDDYTILTAPSGEEGLRVLRDEMPVPLVISDYRMPGMNGVEFLKEVCREWPDTVRVVLSGYADTSAVVTAINEGQIYKFIPKPWNDDELRITVANALERYFLQQRNAQLAGELKEKNAVLRELNEGLERLVEERTAELKRVQQQLLQSEKMSSLGVLSAGIAHEVKNPLAIILQGVDFLKSSLSDALLLDAADRVKKAALRADRIVRDLLSFSRQSPLSFEDLAVVPVIEETLTLVEHQLHLKRVKVGRQFAPDIPPVKMDGNQMKQVFINILLNAADAMPRGGTVVIGTHRNSRGGRSVVEISFADTGLGVAEEDLKRVFDPFFTTKRDTGGTGLGLSVSHGIIERHNGTIEMESRRGEGTRVTIALPCPE
ncbi:MAG: response regulator [Alphaproteobacteria bacterium]|uniref:histidine kinase n=1 Tax=Candidatus Nitrobium versatile TaxID=2884831 RepID=A0A953M2C4_9BACT|nr:response regulator [Candidatus Nitrobium versatile]